MSVSVTTSGMNSSGDTFCARDDHETSLVCLTDVQPPTCCYPDYSPYFTVIGGVYALACGAIGGFGNLLVLVALPYARMRTTDPRSPLKSCTTVLLLSLSLADCLYCFLILSAQGVTILYRKWVLGTGYCYLFAFAGHFLGVASPNSLAAATMSRTLALWWPAGAAMTFEPYSGIPAVVLVWVISSAVPILAAVQHQLGYSRRLGLCDFVNVDEVTANISFGLAGAHSCVTVLVCILLIWVKLRQNWTKLKQFKDMGQSTLNDLKAREQRMAVLLTLLAGVYALTTVPVIIMFEVCPGGPFTTPCVYFSCYAFCFFSINVFLYVFRIKSYRDAITLFYNDARTWMGAVVRRSRRKINACSNILYATDNIDTRF